MSQPVCTYCSAPWLPACEAHLPVGFAPPPTAPDSRFQPQTPAVRLAQALTRKGGRNPYEAPS